MNTELAQNVELPGGFAANPVLIKGHGKPLVYLHGPFGQEWDAFLDRPRRASQGVRACACWSGGD
jgi:hypothetical protein